MRLRREHFTFSSPRRGCSARGRGRACCFLCAYSTQPCVPCYMQVEVSSSTVTLHELKVKIWKQILGGQPQDKLPRLFHMGKELKGEEFTLSLLCVGTRQSRVIHLVNKAPTPIITTRHMDTCDPYIPPCDPYIPRGRKKERNRLE